MPVSLNNTQIVFDDATTQTTAASPGIGVGQTWQFPSRSLGTTYTNTTGKPIMVCISSNNVATTQVRVDEQFIARAYAGSGESTASVIVPNGSTYRANNGGVASWAELR
jgi:hypothetical protein